ncbi:MAG TPA: PepSY-associated TM helix domain-containing protein [Pseudonocardiaceae bacterium]|jgi:uncharacterized iron-regulated membrane protein|nr:PepSY-associated TM helix domain-containing protein [Pseudonocardiaceae bacterium]
MTTGEALPDAAVTRTEAAAAVPAARKGFRRWLRRRPVRRSLVLTHRWTSLVLGLLLVIETTTGAVLLFHGEYFRATHGSFYRHTASATPISAERAMDIVATAHPEFGATWVSADNGIFAVGDATYTQAYAVDPGTGRINGLAHLEDGVAGWLANLHDCALTCQGYPGYVPALAATAFGDVTWGSLIIGVLGVLMILLAVTGVITWWPGFRRMSHGFRVRTGKGRFARDYDLHNVIGIVAVPFLLMWGVTGASFEFPAVQNAWLAITGGHSVDDSRYTFTPDAAHGAAVTATQAADIALAHVPGEVRYLIAATKDADYYTVSVASGYRPYDHRVFFGGDRTVYVDAHDAGHVKVAEAADTGANAFYDRVFEASHFGWMVNGWWRIVWFVLGMAPLALAVTGLSTWLFRRGVKRRRAAAA